MKTDPRPSELHRKQTREYHDILIPALCEVERRNGYAIAVHDSLERDIDLVAIPWTETATPCEYLVQDILKVVESVFHVDRIIGPTLKLHGRVNYLIYLCSKHYIDLSIRPRIDK